jgi:alpha-ribazole phosphatase
MDIYLIRHTKTDTVSGLCYGQSDVPLAASFPEEAQFIREKLPELSKNCLVITSPLNRCSQLAQTFRNPIKTDVRLLEVDFGEWENRLFNEIDEALLSNWTENFVTVPPPKGESFNDLCGRAGRFWDELLLDHANVEQILIVTHAGVIRALLTHILQLPPENAFKFSVDVGSIHKIKYINDYTYIQFINR